MSHVFQILTKTSSEQRLNEYETDVLVPQLCFIILAGRFDSFSKSKLQFRMKQVLKLNIFLAFIVVESERQSLLESKKVSFINGKI